LTKGNVGDTNSRKRQTPVKVLFVTPFSWLYGEALSLLQLVNSLDRNLYLPYVLTTGDGPLVARLNEAKIPVQSIKMPYVSRRGKQAVDFALSLVPVSLWMANYIRSERFDLVYNNTLLNPYGTLAAYLAGVPSIWHVREVGRESSLRRQFLRLTAKLATRLVVVSESVGQLYTGEEREKLRVVYNGIDPQFFDPEGFDREAIRQSYQIQPDQPVISIIGRLHESKKHGDLLIATKSLIKDWPDLQVLIVGDGPIEENIKSQICGMGLEMNVRLLGYMDDVREVLVASDLLVLPSEHEAFGRAIAEAMLMKKPVIATNVGGLPELITPETGLLVPVGCPDELHIAIDTILNDPDRMSKMGQCGRERAVSLFSLDRYSNQMIRVFEELL
jgi:glycosyltransferase involved in cell wall biosynthesis